MGNTPGGSLNWTAAPAAAPAPAQASTAPGGSLNWTPAPASSALTSEADAAAQAPNAAQQAHKTVGDLIKPTHIYDPTTKTLQPLVQPTQYAPEGVIGGVKRNTVGAVTGIYHALNDPVTPQESAELLQKVREYNSRPDVMQGALPKIPESSAQNPSKASLAYHRIIDAPADVLLKKGKDETEAAKDLLANHEYWRGGNLYLNGLTSRLLSGVPMLGPAIDSIAERAEHGDASGAATDVAGMLALEHAPAIIKGAGNIAGKAAETIGETAGRIPGKVGDVASKTTEAIKPEWLTKHPETPLAQHGVPANCKSAGRTNRW